MAERPLYRISQTARDVGLESSALKFYEREGLIRPTIDEENGYRGYTCSNFGRLVNLRLMRGMGMSIERIARSCSGDAASELAICEEQRAANDAQIAQLQQANRMIHDKESLLRGFVEHMGSAEVRQALPMWFIAHFSQEELISGAGDAVAASLASLSKARAATIGVRVGREAFERADPAGITWGVAIRDRGEEDAPELPERAEHVEGRTALVAYAQVERTEDFSVNLYPVMRGFLDAAGLSLADDAFCLGAHLCDDGPGGADRPLLSLVMEMPVEVP